jgi:DNA (cytosine-5)-methyltransferase 1
MNGKPSVISLFAGCGGSSLGYKWAGFKELLAIEWDKNAVDTFKLNFPEVPIWKRDIKEIAAKEILTSCNIKEGDLSVLDGSPPCQGFSTAGKRIVKDERNDLFKEYIRLIEGLSPKMFVMENVSGMIKGKMKGRFNQILNTLKNTDYIVKCKLLNAANYGVAQSRQRLIFVGKRKDIKKDFNWPAVQGNVKTTRDVFSELSNIQDEEINHTWIDESPKGKNTKTYHLAKRAKQGQKYAGHQKRIKYNEPAPTICKPSSDKLKISPYLRNSHCHPEYTRTLSVRELARIGSFPDDFKFLREGGADRIGNSVPPLLMKAIAMQVQKTLHA